MEYVNDLTVNLGVILVALILGYSFGRIAEKRHYRSILRREAALNDLIVVTTRTLPKSAVPPTTQLVMGNVVISQDYFKRFAASIKGIFGGNIRVLEPLLERARREALIRMKGVAHARGYETVINVRLETATLASSRSRGKGTAGVEMLAYGTAIKLANGRGAMRGA